MQVGQIIRLNCIFTPLFTVYAGGGGAGHAAGGLNTFQTYRCSSFGFKKTCLRWEREHSSHLTTSSHHSLLCQLLEHTRPLS